MEQIKSLQRDSNDLLFSQDYGVGSVGVRKLTPTYICGIFWGLPYTMLVKHFLFQGIFLQTS
ncbi:MAG: hypothetical protein DRR00_19250 [Candidatus Parabeggiatoa sp. nov. 3]|nr:MAG: hypothetical protein DRR00_19250 [Gammaproteobacteria bacterium]RKZ68203.1 MAG: hypothetical protein DRQ99_04535 [Gammaproteobacteria bacterium]